jgi:RNA ligase (TIGR02306 family)
LETHPNADTLSLVRGILGGYTCGVKTEAFKDECVAVFIPPDSLIPVERPEFAFLKGLAYRDGHPYAGYARVTVKKFRGLYSEGLLVQVPPGFGAANIGEDMAEVLGVKHYEPVPGLAGGNRERTDGGSEGIEGFGSVYDLENIKRYSSVFQDGEHVVMTEKIHGCNARYRWKDGRLWCGSRQMWKKDGDNAWWNAARAMPAIETFLQRMPEYTLFGEVYGAVQKYKYGQEPGKVSFVAFDMFNENLGAWVPHGEFSAMCAVWGIPQVPVVYNGPFSMDKVLEVSEGPSIVSPEGVPCREGVVVKPLAERWHGMCGRAILKSVGNGYLESEH